VRRIAIALLVAACVALPAAYSIAAEEEYYIELGGDVAKGDAAKEWQALAAKHKRLQHLKFYPKAVIESGREVATRLQAGPIAGKGNAQKICTALFAQNIPCFVIEGVGAAPPTSVISMAEKEKEASALPWQPAAEKPASAAVSEEKPLPWRSGNVEVAEAIRVPLSDSLMPSRPPVSVRTLAAPASSRPAANAEAADGNNSGWLNVEAFPDENSASAFWQHVRESVPEKAAGLRVRIVTPAVSRDQPQVTLNVGPFAGRNDAYAFCRDGIQAMDKNLHCRFDTTETAGVATSVTPRYQHGDAYAARRQALAVGRSAAFPALPGKLYWVQVLSAGSQLEALRAWEDLKTANQDILEGRRSSVSASLADKTRYVVRVGPLTGDDDAMSLCAALKVRGVDCQVLLYTSM